MSDLNVSEKRKLEELFEMNTGYVLKLTNDQFRDLVFDCLNLDIYGDKYSGKGISKAKRLREFWRVETNDNVVKLTEALLLLWREEKPKQLSKDDEDLYKKCRKIIDTLFKRTTVAGYEVLENDINVFTAEIMDSIKKNRPAIALDRLHTYTVKFIRELCTKHGLKFEKKDALHVVYGKYVKHLVGTGKIKSDMTKKILSNAKNLMPKFCFVRNHYTLSHDNDILNSHESMLIISTILSCIRFIKAIEDNIES